MDIEKLKLILETLQAAGDTAAMVAVLWLVLEYVLTPAFILAGVFLVLRMGIVLIQYLEGSNSFIAECRDRLGTGDKGYLTVGERRGTEALLRKLVDKHLEEKDK